MVIAQLEQEVRAFCETQDGAHDWYHIDRVRRMALYIAGREGGDSHLVEISALVHDIGDFKTHQDDAAGRAAVEALLTRVGVGNRLRDDALEIAMSVSFKGAGVPDNMPFIEGKIVQDADRLDAIGAIGIGRVFTWGGAHGRPLYTPGESILLAQNAEEYYPGGGSSIHHFQTKLLLLKDRLHTNTAQRVAQTRHEFMQRFVDLFMIEWNGKDCI